MSGRQPSSALLANSINRDVYAGPTRRPDPALGIMSCLIALRREVAMTVRVRLRVGQEVRDIRNRGSSGGRKSWRTSPHRQGATLRSAGPRLESACKHTRGRQPSATSAAGHSKSWSRSTKRATDRPGPRCCNQATPVAGWSSRSVLARDARSHRGQSQCASERLRPTVLLLRRRCEPTPNLQTTPAVQLASGGSVASPPRSGSIPLRAMF